MKCQVKGTTLEPPVAQWMREHGVKMTEANYDAIQFFGQPPTCRICSKRMVIEADGELVYCSEGHGGLRESQEAEEA
jgi:hypothetical protein